MAEEIAVELVGARVFRVDRPWEDGIALKEQRTLPFVVERSWAGPAGYYVEQWSLRRGMKQIVHQSPARYVRVRGIQSVTTEIDRVSEPIELEPGIYTLVLVLNGVFLGSVEVEARAPTDAAA